MDLHNYIINMLTVFKYHVNNNCVCVFVNMKSFTKAVSRVGLFNYIAV